MTNVSSAKRRYLALFFPFLPAERLRRDGALSDTPPDAPLVLVERSGNALRLAAVDARAQALGLTPGQALADARAWQPELIAIAMDAPADAHWLALLARQCGDFSPAVEIVPPDTILLDIAGAAHLFGGEGGLADALLARLTEAGVTARHALADTPVAARALAHHVGHPADDEAAAIRALPVAALGLAAEATTALCRAGLTRIGDVAVRPLAGIAARFGAGAVGALRQLLGEEQVPLTPLPHHAPLRFERRFAEPVAHQASIAAALLELLGEAVQALAERALGGRRFRLALDRSDGAKRRLDIVTGAPTRDPALVLRLFDERIAALADPLDPGFGYDRLTLAVPVTDALDPVQRDFAGDAPGSDGLAELIDRLSTRLGAGAVRRLVPQDSHIPEQGQLALPAIHCSAPQRWPAPAPGEPPLRPLFLFDPPQPVEAVAEVPDGPPLRFRWRRKLHEVRLFEGPERIAAEWWRRVGGEEAGQGGLTRDYYRIEDERGRRYWLFRHGLYDEKPQPKWYLHGLFA